MPPMWLLLARPRSAVRPGAAGPAGHRSLRLEVRRGRERRQDRGLIAACAPPAASSPTQPAGRRPNASRRSAWAANVATARPRRRVGGLGTPMTLVPNRAKPQLTLMIEEGVGLRHGGVDAGADAAARRRPRATAVASRVASAATPTLAATGRTSLNRDRSCRRSISAASRAAGSASGRTSWLRVPGGILVSVGVVVVPLMVVVSRRLMAPMLAAWPDARQGHTSGGQRVERARNDRARRDCPPAPGPGRGGVGLPAKGRCALASRATRPFAGPAGG
jgi:hypothetical protein